MSPGRTLLTTAFVAFGMLALHTQARAEDAPAQAYLVTGPEREALEPRAQRWLREHDVAATSLAAPLPEPDAGFAEAELAPLEAAEQALTRARALAAEFAEGQALLVLVEAERALREHLELPAAHAFLAELYVQMALVSASLGERGLVDTALRRAASLDPQRSLQAGEASPDLLALARSIERARDGAARSRIHVETTPGGAEVQLDGVRVGVSPCLIDAAPGLHVLTIRLPAHRPFASALELEGGERPALQVALSVTPAEAARRAALAAGPQVDLSAALGALTPQPYGRVWLFEPDPLSAGFLRVLACDAAGCQRQAMLRTQEAPVRRELHENDRRGPLWRRWPLWVGVALAVGAAATTTALVLSRDESTRRERVLNIDPGTLPGAD